jgi:aminopeptidase N
MPTQREPAVIKRNMWIKQGLTVFTSWLSSEEAEPKFKWEVGFQMLGVEWKYVSACTDVSKDSGSVPSTT